MTPETVTRNVGICSHCGTSVILHVRRVGLCGVPAGRAASCSCGATQIPAAFFHTARWRRSA
jgi:hypothetical protein